MYFLNSKYKIFQLFLSNYTVLREHAMYGFNPFVMVKISFTDQYLDDFCKCSGCT